MVLLAQLCCWYCCSGLPTGVAEGSVTMSEGAADQPAHTKDARPSRKLWRGNQPTHSCRCGKEPKKKERILNAQKKRKNGASGHTQRCVKITLAAKQEMIERLSNPPN